MIDHIDFGALGNLPETRGGAVRLSMHVQRLIGRRGALRDSLRGIVRHAAQVVHLFRHQKLMRVGPAFDSLRRAHSYKPAFVFQNLQPVAMLDGGCNGRLG